jgi:hypothetical protein
LSLTGAVKADDLEAQVRAITRVKNMSASARLLEISHQGQRYVITSGP